MDAKLLYWTVALVILCLVVACASVGVRRIRRRDVRGHRRMMLSAAALVGLFIASYVVKVLLLGKEGLEVWDRTSLVALYVHESCILVMLIAGALAATRARSFRRVLDAFPFDADRAPRADALALARRRHRRAGWAAVISGALALVTATQVLRGMYARADEPRGAPTAAVGGQATDPIPLGSGSQ